MFTWLNGSEDRPPVFLKFRSSKAFIIFTVATAIFTDVFVYAVPVPYLPLALTSRSHIDPQNVQTWISVFLAAYCVSLIITSPFFGWLADRLESRWWPFLGGLIALAGSSVMLCLGEHISVLVGARILQGVSSTIVWVVGMALIVDTAGVEGIGQAFSFVGMGMSFALLLAPLFGGIVFAKAGYYAVFAMVFGLIAFDIILRVAMIEKKVAAKWLEIDDHKTSLKVVERIAVAEVETGEKQSKNKPTAVSTIVCEVDIEKGSAKNSQNVSSTATQQNQGCKPVFYILLSSGRIMSGLWCSTIASGMFTALDAILPLFVVETFHWNSLGAGLILLPVLVTSFAGLLMGILSDKYGPKWFVVTGCMLACPCFILLRLIEENTLTQKVVLCVILTFLGLGLNTVLTPLAAEIAYGVEAEAARRGRCSLGKNGAYAQAYSLFNIAWAAGGMLGPLLGGLLKQSYGWRTSTLVLSMLTIITALPALLWTGGKLFAKKEQLKPSDS